MVDEHGYWEQENNEDSGAVDYLLMGARSRAAKGKISAHDVLQKMLEEKEELLKNEKTAMGKHETGNWIKWVKTAISLLDEE